jgi:hypothetical protein
MAKKAEVPLKQSGGSRASAPGGGALAQALMAQFTQGAQSGREAVARLARASSGGGGSDDLASIIDTLTTSIASIFEKAEGERQWRERAKFQDELAGKREREVSARKRQEALDDEMAREVREDVVRAEDFEMQTERDRQLEAGRLKTGKALQTEAEAANIRTEERADDRTRLNRSRLQANEELDLQRAREVSQSLAQHRKWRTDTVALGEAIDLDLASPDIHTRTIPRTNPDGTVEMVPAFQELRKAKRLNDWALSVGPTEETLPAVMAAEARYAARKRNLAVAGSEADIREAMRGGDLQGLRPEGPPLPEDQEEAILNASPEDMERVWFSAGYPAPGALLDPNRNALRTFMSASTEAQRIREDAFDRNLQTRQAKQAHIHNLQKMALSKYNELAVIEKTYMQEWKMGRTRAPQAVQNSLLNIMDQLARSPDKWDEAPEMFAYGLIEEMVQSPEVANAIRAYGDPAQDETLSAGMDAMLGLTAIANIRAAKYEVPLALEGLPTEGGKGGSPLIRQVAGMIQHDYRFKPVKDLLLHRGRAKDPDAMAYLETGGGEVEELAVIRRSLLDLANRGMSRLNVIADKMDYQSPVSAMRRAYGDTLRAADELLVMRSWHEQEELKSSGLEPGQMPTRQDLATVIGEYDPNAGPDLPSSRDVEMSISRVGALGHILDQAEMDPQQRRNVMAVYHSSLKEQGIEPYQEIGDYVTNLPSRYPDLRTFYDEMELWETAKRKQEAKEFMARPANEPNNVGAGSQKGSQTRDLEPKGAMTLPPAGF